MEAGEVLIFDSQTGEPIRLLSIYTKEGFSPNDINSRDYKLSPVHKILDSNRFDKRKIKNAIQLINTDCKSNIEDDTELIKSVITKSGEIRYKIVDDKLDDFLMHCYNILTLLIQILTDKWRVMGNPSRNGPDVKWFYDILGYEKASNFFDWNNTETTRRDVGKSLYSVKGILQPR